MPRTTNFLLPHRTMGAQLAKVRRDRPLREAIDLAHEAGRKYVTIASSVLAGK